MLAGFSSYSGIAEKSASKYFGSKHYGSKQFGNLSNVQSMPNTPAQSRPSFNTTWGEEEEGLQLRGLPPPMGHFVSIEGGSVKQGPTKLPKSLQRRPSTSGSFPRSPKRSLSTRNSEEGFFGDKHTITMTQDFKHYSGTGSDTDVSFSDKFLTTYLGVADIGRF